MIWWLLHNTLSATVFAVAAAMACRWWRAHPALRHAIWLVVLLKLVAPPLPAWSFAWPGPSLGWWPRVIQSTHEKFSESDGVGKADQFATLGDDFAPQAIARSSVPGNPESYEVIGNAERDAFPNRTRAGSITTISPALQGNASPQTWLQRLAWRDVERYVLAAWIVCAVGMAACQALRWHRMRRLLDATQFAPDWLEQEVRESAREVHVTPPEVRVLNARCTPHVWVLGRVRLIWPETMLAGFSHESRRTIIAHELAHLARRDHWVARFETIASVFWWWHPLFWFVRARLHDAAEQACDARVIQLLPEARRAYAQSLIDVCQLLPPAFAPEPALGIGSQTRNAFERRLTMIMRENLPHRLSLGAMISTGLVALAVLPGFTPAQVALPSIATPASTASDPNTVLTTPRPAVASTTTDPAPPDAASATQPSPDPNSGAAPVAAASPLTIQAQPAAAPGLPPTALGPLPNVAPGHVDTGAEEVIQLTRATYRLSQPLAESFAAYLNATLSDAVQAEVKALQVSSATDGPGSQPEAADSSRLIVTADEETQRVVGHFIGLLRTHGKLKAGTILVPRTPPGLTPSINPTTPFDGGRTAPAKTIDPAQIRPR